MRVVIAAAGVAALTAGLLSAGTASASASPSAPSGSPSAHAKPPVAATVTRHGEGPLAKAAHARRHARATPATPVTRAVPGRQSVTPMSRAQSVRRAEAGATTQDPGTFVTLPPARLLDTRSGLGGSTPGAGGTVHLQVSGHGGVPLTGVSAVVLNVTAVAPAAQGYITVYADGAARPSGSNLNFIPGRTVPNLVVAPVSSAGRVALYNGSRGATRLLADVSGFYLSGTPVLPGTFHSLAPTRILDTRSTFGGTTPAAKGEVQLKVLGRGGVPAVGVSAVILNVTVVGPSAGGYLTVYGSGAARPLVSNLNFSKGQTVPNLVVAPIGTAGQVALFNGGLGATPLLADVAGYFLAGTATAPGTFKVLPPVRAMDTRQGFGADRPGPHQSAYLAVDGSPSGRRTGVPSSDVSAVVMNVTVTAPTANGYITVYTDDTANVPTTSNLNFLAGQTVPNLAFAPVGADGYVAFYNGSTGQSDLLADIAGYYLGNEGSLSGSVTAASDGTLLPNVIVEAVSADGTVGFGTETDTDGTYELTNLPAGDYQVCFDAQTGDPSDGGSGGPSATGYAPECSSATVTAASTTTVDAALQPGGAISGTVTGTDTAGTGLGNVEVDVSDGSGTSYTVSDLHGNYLLGSLGTGSYQVCFYGGDAVNGATTGYQLQCLPTYVTVQAGATTPGQNISLSPGGAITGTIAFSGAVTGDTIDFFGVDVFDSTGAQVGAGTSIDANGGYRVGGLPGGSDTVCFDGAYDEDTGTGYAGQCYNNRPWDGSEQLPLGTTPVSTSVGAVHGGINATLQPAA